MRRPLAVPDSEFLVVDLPAQGLVLAQHTADVAGSTADSIQEGAQKLHPDIASSHLVLLQGFDEHQFRRLLRDMRRQYPDITVLSEEPGVRTWVLRNRVKTDHVAAKQMLALGKAEAEFGLYWTHIQEGTFQLRARAVSSKAASKDVDRLRAAFAKMGISANVRLLTLGEGDRAVSRLLEELLVQYPA
jgi:hypothetical protein